MKTFAFNFALILALLCLGFTLTGLSQSKKEANFTSFKRRFT